MFANCKLSPLSCVLVATTIYDSEPSQFSLGTSSSPLPCTQCTMSQEGANQPHEVERSHGRATSAKGSTTAIVGLAIMRSTNSSTVSKLASEDNIVESKISSLAVLHANENNNVGFKIASPAPLHANEVKEKTDGSKLVSPMVLHAIEDKKDECKLSIQAIPHAGEGNSLKSKLTSPVILFAGEENNTRSKMQKPTTVHVSADKNTGVGFKHNSSAEPYAGENNIAKSHLASQVVLHASEDKDNNVRSNLTYPMPIHSDKDNTRSKVSIQVVPQVGENNNIVSKLSIQGMPHADEDKNSRSNLTMSAGLHGNKSNIIVSKIAIQEVPHAGEDSNIESKLSTATSIHASKEKKVVSNLSIQVAAHAGKDNINSRSKLSRPMMLSTSKETSTKSKLNRLAMLYADKGENSMSKVIVQALPCVGSKLARPAVLRASKDINVASKLSIHRVSHASEDNINVRSKIPGLGEENSVASKIVVPVVSYVNEGNNTGSKLAKTTVLHASKENNTVPKLTVQVVPNTGERNSAKEGKNIIAREDTNKSISAASGSDGTPSNTFKNSTLNCGDIGAHNTTTDAPTTISHGDRGSGKGKGAMVVETEDALHMWTEKERRKKIKNLYSTLHALLPQLPEKVDKPTLVGKAVTHIKSLEGTLQRLEKLKQERMRAQEVVVITDSSSNSATPASSPARHPASEPADPATREASLADMVQGLNAQEALVDKLKVAAAASVVAGAGGSSAAAAACRAPAVAAPAPEMQTWSAPNAVLSVADMDAVINLRTPRRPHMLNMLLDVLERHLIDVVSFSVSSDQSHNLISIQAHVSQNGPSILAIRSIHIYNRGLRRSDPFLQINGPAPATLLEKLRIEDRYKMAVAEMMYVVAN
ncbi:hypothetical protein HU200_018496 [Digitaria exilis]|uniref:BHLH domain-containing protein n=1 Tax=Digitaria exilis TaxID=1010633 RepID=A0A835F3Z4_9POAL|nr:hypothetical protein HU200_018496 [Digitaria exilis]